MSDIGNVLAYYEDARESFARKDYKSAARLFRLCYITYQTGEFPEFNSEVKRYGTDALRRYNLVLNKYLSPEARKEFEREDDTFGDLEDLFGY